MQINNWLRVATLKLKTSSIPSAALDAEVLLSYVLNKPKEYIFSHPEITLTKKQTSILDRLIKKRAQFEPVAYLTHNKEFYGLDFYVDKNVLIPRPETELLVDAVLNDLKNNSSVIIADIGTGSGCIAVAIAKNMPKVTVIASDISKKALAVAKTNAKRLGVENQIRFVHGDLLNVIDTPVQIIIANLPYLPMSEQKKEISYEPKQALFGKNSGLEFLEKIIEQSPGKLKAGGKMILEIHPPQSMQIESYVHNIFPEANIKIIKDLAGKERILSIQL
ncbi:MAG: peptide chain release factor N(5)-glutamine methyltransferase [Patescibacteria group bacterium]